MWISLNRLELHGSQHLQAILRDITERRRSEQIRQDNIRIKRELEIAQEIQQALLPTCAPSLPGLQVACRYLPATSVGGDYFDFFSLESGGLDAVIADVAGHSVGSALLMTEARSVLHAKVTIENPPARLLGKVNDILYRDLSRAELQLSMFYTRFDIRNSTLTYANAGHTRPLLYRAQDGSMEQLDGDGLLMGIHRNVVFEERSTVIANGDIVLLHTDGITDAENAHGDFFGTERLSRVLVNLHEQAPDQIMQGIFDALNSFRGETPLSDDVSLALLKVVSV